MSSDEPEISLADFRAPMRVVRRQAAWRGVTVFDSLAAAIGVLPARHEGRTRLMVPWCLGSAASRLAVVRP